MNARAPAGRPTASSCPAAACQPAAAPLGQGCDCRRGAAIHAAGPAGPAAHAVTPCERQTQAGRACHSLYMLPVAYSCSSCFCSNHVQSLARLTCGWTACMLPHAVHMCTCIVPLAAASTLAAAAQTSLTLSAQPPARSAVIALTPLICDLPLQVTTFSVCPCPVAAPAPSGSPDAASMAVLAAVTASGTVELVTLRRGALQPLHASITASLGERPHAWPVCEGCMAGRTWCGGSSPASGITRLACHPCWPLWDLWCQGLRWSG